MTITDTVYNLCHGTETVSSELAKNPSAAPSDIYKRLYGKYDHEISKKHQLEGNEITEEDLKRAEECGRWGPTKPSELFLKVYKAPETILKRIITDSRLRYFTMHLLRWSKASPAQLSARHSSAAVA